MNHSAELSPSEDPEEFDGGTAVVCVILGLSFLVGAPGNLLVIWTILRHVKQRSHTVVLLLHLAAADLLVLITLPLWIYSLAHTWVFGEHFCKALVYIVNVCMFSSIFFITLMSVERYLAICHPFVMMRWKTKSIMNRCLVFLWLFALLLGVPAILTRTVDESDGAEQCLSMEVNSLTHAILFLCVEIFGGFVVPFIILTVCYCLVAAQLRKMSFNSKQKSMVLVHTVVIAFTVCWLPYHIINITDLVCILGSGTEHECVPKSIVYTSGALVFISSSVNPVLYALFARNLRGSLEESRLVRLFQEIATHTNKLREMALQQQAGQRAANTQVELMSDSLCEKNTVNP
ncbi:leukotriene B4 receptor 1-like [Amphiprion ocellaris]|uniref:G-protein coupled receptors family 1 profile domain-containing protein n=1 Tax=Amphiprion ocellaris TaxID=80972 RepID=A0AAQ6AH03_AMPOC|nr:leukotriene B4 receptor 1-like [Amphiprion ocellaris]